MVGVLLEIKRRHGPYCCSWEGGGGIACLLSEPGSDSRLINIKIMNSRREWGGGEEKKRRAIYTPPLPIVYENY